MSEICIFPGVPPFLNMYLSQAIDFWSYFRILKGELLVPERPCGSGGDPSRMSGSTGSLPSEVSRTNVSQTSASADLTSSTAWANFSDIRDPIVEASSGRLHLPGRIHPPGPWGRMLPPDSAVTASAQGAQSRSFSWSSTICHTFGNRARQGGGGTSDGGGKSAGTIRPGT